jgi:hypothetical protein
MVSTFLFTMTHYNYLTSIVFFFPGLDNQHNLALWDFSIMVITLKHAFLYLPIKPQQDPNLKVV